MDTKIHTLGALCGNTDELVRYSLTLRKRAVLRFRLRRSDETRYRLIHRGRGNGIFYCVDSKSGKRTSLEKVTKEEGRQIVDAKNQAERQPMLNLQLAKAYLAGTNAEMPKRTWQHALQVLTETKRGANKERWKRVAKDRTLSGSGAAPIGTKAQYARAISGRRAPACFRGSR